MTEDELKAEIERLRLENEKLKQPVVNEPSDLEKRLRAAFSEPEKKESEEMKELKALKADLEDIKGISKEKLLEGLSAEDKEKIKPIIQDMPVTKAKQTIEAILGFKVVTPAGALPAGSTGGTKEPTRYEEGYVFKKDPKWFNNGMVS